MATKTKLKNLKGSTDMYTATELQSTVDNVDAWANGDVSLVGPSLSGTWTIKDSTGEQIKTETTATITVETGFKTSWSGNYSWSSKEGYKDPTSYTTTGFATNAPSGTTPPSSGTSVAYSISERTTNGTGKVTQYAPKRGLMVSGTKVTPATGNDNTSAQVSVTYQSRRFFGYTSTIPTASNISSIVSNLVSSSSDLSSSKNVTKTVQTTGDTAGMYYVYAYASSLGNLTKITMDGATPVLGAFTKYTYTRNNAALVDIAMVVYVSNNPGAFPNSATLAFA